MELRTGLRMDNARRTVLACVFGHLSHETFLHFMPNLFLFFFILSNRNLHCPSIYHTKWFLHFMPNLFLFSLFFLEFFRQIQFIPVTSWKWRWIVKLPRNGAIQRKNIPQRRRLKRGDIGALKGMEKRRNFGGSRSKKNLWKSSLSPLKKSISQVQFPI